MKKGTEPAFPLVEQRTDLNIYNGINIRLYLAGMAMQGIIAYDPYCVDEEVAKKALKLADELIKQEEETR